HVTRLLNQVLTGQTHSWWMEQSRPYIEEITQCFQGLETLFEEEQKTYLKGLELALKTKLTNSPSLESIALNLTNFYPKIDLTLLGSTSKEHWVSQLKTCQQPLTETPEPIVPILRQHRLAISKAYSVDVVEP
ncbi:MAG: hypothetical protein VYA34_16315, partial [Myxococcota bacterium]|nr:hypothetical protein [Myxococcota bacterium]